MTHGGSIGKTILKRYSYSDSSNVMKAQPSGLYVWILNEANISYIFKS